MLALAVPAAWPQGAPGSAAQFYEDALQRYQRKDIKGAIVQLKNAVRLDNRQLAAQVLLGKALLEDGDVIAAEVALSNALSLGVNRAEVVLPLAQSNLRLSRPRVVLEDPRFATAGLPTGLQAELLLLKAEAQSDLGAHPEALKLIGQARELQPGEAKLAFTEVTVRIRAQQFKEALQAANTALAARPEDAQAHYLLGSALHAGGNIPAAEAAYTAALKRDATHLESLLARAGVRLDAGRTAEATADVDAARAAAPSDPRANYLAGLLAERRGDTRAAKAALAEVTSLLDPVPIEAMRFRPQLLVLGGLSHYGLGQKEKALPYLEAAQRALPTSPAAKLLAELLLENNKLDSATLILEGYLRGHPGDAQAQALLASTHLAKGRGARAVQVYEEAIKRRDTPALRAGLGLTLLQLDRVQAALPHLEAAWRQDPGQIAAGTGLTNAYLRLRATRKAVAVAEALAKQSRTAQSYNLLGSALGQAGDAAKSRAAFESALKLEPNNVNAALSLARLDTAKGDLAAATARLQSALKTQPQNVEALIDAALLAERQGRAAELTALLERAHTHSPPNEMKAGLLLLTNHLRAGRLDAAQEIAKQLNERAPGTVAGQMASARVAIERQDLPSARTALTRASTAAEFDAGSLVEVARMQLRAQDFKGAYYSLSKALQSSPRLLSAQALMVEAELYAGELAQAEARAKSVVAQNPKLALAHSLQGQVAMVKGDVNAGIEAYRRAHAAQPSPGTAATLYRAMAAKDASAAMAFLQQWSKSRPQDADALRLLAEGHARNGQMAQAKPAFEAALKLRPDDSNLLNNYAHVLIALKDPQALKTAERALALQPQSAQVIATTGWAAHHAGQRDRALQLLRDARLRDPDNGEYRYFLATVLAGLGRKAEARQELDAVLATASPSLLSGEQARALRASLQ